MSDILKQLLTTGTEPLPPRILLYGVHGIGKSTWASQKKYDPIYVPTEDGIRQLDVPKFPVAETWFELMKHLTILLKEDHEFRTLVIDTIDWAEKLCERFVADKAGKDTVMDIGFGKGQAAVRKEVGVMLDLLDRINKERGMVIILLGHCESKTFNSPMSDPYDRYGLKMHERTATLVEEWCDCELFVNYKIHVVKSENPMLPNKAKNKKERVVYCNELPAFRAKNRYNLPDTMNFSYDEILGAIYAEINRREKNPIDDEMPDWAQSENE